MVHAAWATFFCSTPRRTLNRVIQRMVKRASKSAVQSISANVLKTGGIDAISRALEHEREVGLNVRGDLRYVVMEADAYQGLRECELEIALQKPAPTSPLVASSTNRSTITSSGWMPWPSALPTDQPNRCRIQRGFRRASSTATTVRVSPLMS